MQNIPQTIHYCWFGKNEKPDIVLKCIESWKKYMPEYTIVEWNEDNYDINKDFFLKEAYQSKKWAFVSDYARFDIINEYGGIYVDTDVEFLKTIPNEMLEDEAFTGFEFAGKISPGLIYAAIPDFKITKEILNEYKKMHFENSNDQKYITVNMVTTEVLERYSSLNPNIIQVIEGLRIYPSEYFCGYDQDVKEYSITNQTICVHHYAGTWKRNRMSQKMKMLVKKMIGVNNYRKLIHIKRKIKHN